MEALAGAAAAASSALLPSFPAHQSHSRVALRARRCGPLRAASAGGGGGKDDAAKPNGTPVVKVDPSQNGALGPVTTEKSRTTSSTNQSTRNLLSDPRCTLVVQVPGWSGLSNARVTIFGDVYPLPAEQQEWAHKQYVAKHQQWASQQCGKFYYYRMQNISDIYFIGGFGTVAWVDVKQYETIQPDKIAVDGGEQSLKELNAIFSKPLREFMSAEGEVDDAALISVDSKGIDIRVRQGAQFNIQRLAFDVPYKVETLEEAKRALHKIIKTSSK
ncbi:hypothetical protein ZWY2020_048514 [Hordeum vulgare]|nr:hypothetical protein ZWY2020_048514 [Hordeum vulgare]